jgi:hypothetical protein
MMRTKVKFLFCIGITIFFLASLGFASASTTYNLVSVNNTLAGQITNFAINVTDETALHPNGQYIFSTNNTGTWVNYSLFGNWNRWQADLNVNGSVPDMGYSISDPAVFYKDSSWYLINGYSDGLFVGFVWVNNGTGWVGNSTITSGLPSSLSVTTPSVFYKDSSWYLISGNYGGSFYGYAWNGTGWQINTTINASLPTIPGGTSSPSVFYKDSSWYLISGGQPGSYYGYAWNGTAWKTNTTINASLPLALYGYSSPSVFYKDSSWYMISGNYFGIFFGFTYNQSSLSWLPNSTINASLPTLSIGNYPFVFYKDYFWYILSGNDYGIFDSYNLTLSYNFTATPSWANTTKTLNSTAGTVVGYRWYFKDSAGNANSTQVYTLTTTSPPDLTSPTYNSISHNSTYTGQPTLFAINVTDNTALHPNGQYIFSTNNTGSWVNDSMFGASGWQKDLTINASLPDIGGISTPSVFYKDSTWYLISGSEAGKFYSYAWNETQWNKNLTINASLPDFGDYSAPSVFYKDSSWYLISGEVNGNFYGFAYNGTNWLPNSTINSSLPSLSGGYSTPSVFYKDSSWYLISGDSYGGFYGYAWNGTNWLTNLTINASLPDLGDGSAPSVFYKDSSWYLISGDAYGGFYGYAWNGTNWLTNLTINSSLPNILMSSAPSVFYKDSSWYLITGENLGKFYGYKYFNPAINFTETPSWANITKTLNSIAGTVVGYRWYFTDNASNTNSTSIYTLTTIIGAPYFTTIPANSSFFYGNQSLLVTFAATDETQFGYYSINDTRFSINQSGFLSNATPLAVGNYEINVTINDTSNNIVWTRYKVQINKSQDSCSVYFSTSNPATYPDIFVVYTSCSSDYTLYKNGTQITNNSVINNGTGYYNFTVQRTDTENYTNIVDTEFFTVNKDASDCSVYFNTPSPINYPSSFTIYTNCTSSYTLTLNGSIISNSTTITGGVTAYNISVQRTDTANYSNVFHQSQFIITKNNEICKVLFNATSPLEYPSIFRVWANCTSDFVLKRNTTTISNNTIQSLNEGAYNFSFLRTDNVNYTNNYDETQFIIIPDTTSPTYSLASINNSFANKPTLFSVYVNDNSALNPNGQYIFSTNNTGSWINNSAINFTTTPSWANTTKTLNSTVGTVVGYRWYFTDNKTNTESTIIYTLTTTQESNPPSGGGGGSSGNSSFTHYLNREFYEHGEVFNLKKSHRISFICHSESHIFTLERFNAKSARIRIESNPITADLEKGISQQFDLNNDSIDDIRAIYEGVSGSEAQIFFQKIVETTGESIIDITYPGTGNIDDTDNSEPTNTNDNNLGPQQGSTNSKSSSSKVILFSVITIIIILISLSLIGKSEKERKEHYLRYFDR